MIFDSFYYGRLSFPIWSFVQVNILQSIAKFYGTSRFHYYVTEGLPLMLMFHLPFALHGLWSQKKSEQARLVVFVLVVYSLFAHKEVRFLYPLLPILHTFTAFSMSSLTHKRVWIPLLFLGNGLVAYYASQLHQRGVMDVVEYIRISPQINQISFLMPCHSTPWQSHMHRADLSAEFLTCEPPLG